MAGPAENSMSGSVGVVAIKATWLKQGWGQEDGGFVKQLERAEKRGWDACDPLLVLEGAQHGKGPRS